MTVSQSTTGLPSRSPERSYALISEQLRGPRVIDLSNGGPGEPQRGDRGATITPLAPGLFKIMLPWRPVVIGHCRDMDDSSPVYTDGELIAAGSFVFLDAQCPDCDESLHVSPGPQFTMLIVEHGSGCPALAAWVARRPS